MNILGRILNFKRNEIKESRYMHYSNNVIETLRWEDYILKGKISVYKYRRNI